MLQLKQLNDKQYNKHIFSFSVNLLYNIMRLLYVHIILAKCFIIHKLISPNIQPNKLIFSFDS